MVGDREKKGEPFQVTAGELPLKNGHKKRCRLPGTQKKKKKTIKKLEKTKGYQGKPARHSEGGGERPFPASGAIAHRGKKKKESR